VSTPVTRRLFHAIVGMCEFVVERFGDAAKWRCGDVRNEGVGNRRLTGAKLRSIDYSRTRSARDAQNVFTSKYVIDDEWRSRGGLLGARELVVRDLEPGDDVSRPRSHPARPSRCIAATFDASSRKQPRIDRREVSVWFTNSDCVLNYVAHPEFRVSKLPSAQLRPRSPSA
jgi:hypothetical protein